MDRKTFQDEVTELGLKVVKVVDTTEGYPAEKRGFIGFSGFQQAYMLSFKYHMPLEIIRKENGGDWTRLHKFVNGDLRFSQVLSFKEGERDRFREILYKTEYKELADLKLKRLIDNGGSAKEYAACLEEIEATLHLFDKGMIGYDKGSIVYDMEEDKQYGPLKGDSNSSIFGFEVCLCLMDPDEGIKEDWARRVLAGDIIPAVAGLMPEDFIGLVPKMDDGDKRFEVVYDTEAERFIGELLIYDDFGMVGFAYRQTYDGGNTWEWTSISHTNCTPFEESGIWKDHYFVGWSLRALGARNDDETAFEIKPRSFVPEESSQNVDLAYYKNLAEQRLQQIKELEADTDSTEQKTQASTIRELRAELKALKEERDELEYQNKQLTAEREYQKKNDSMERTIVKGNKVLHFGRNVQSMLFSNGEIIINGQRVTSDDNGNVIVSGSGNVYNVEVTGNVDQLRTTSGDVTVQGTAGHINTASGDVDVKQGVNGSVNTASGDIHVGGSVKGSCHTMSGNIYHR